MNNKYPNNKYPNNKYKTNNKFPTAEDNTPDNTPDNIPDNGDELVNDDCGVCGGDNSTCWLDASLSLSLDEASNTIAFNKSVIINNTQLKEGDWIILTSGDHMGVHGSTNKMEVLRYRDKDNYRRSKHLCLYCYKELKQLI